MKQRRSDTHGPICEEIKLYESSKYIKTGSKYPPLKKKIGIVKQYLSERNEIPPPEKTQDNRGGGGEINYIINTKV